MVLLRRQKARRMYACLLALGVLLAACGSEPPRIVTTCSCVDVSAPTIEGALEIVPQLAELMRCKPGVGVDGTPCDSWRALTVEIHPEFYRRSDPVRTMTAAPVPTDTPPTPTPEPTVDNVTFAYEEDVAIEEPTPADEYPIRFFGNAKANDYRCLRVFDGFVLVRKTPRSRR